MNNLQQRILTALIGSAIMIGAMLWNQYSFAALFLFIAIMSQLEFHNLSKEAGIHPQKWTALLCGIVLHAGIFISYILEGEGLFAFFTTYEMLVKTLLASLGVTFIIFLIELYRKSAQPFTNIAYTLMGIAYIPLTLSLVHFIARIDGEYHPSVILCYFLIVWANDIGAYFIGKRFGKRKLFERISPGKTWEGSIGGAALAFIVAHFIADNNSVFIRFDWLIITIIIIVFGTYGDLVKSMFKRSINRKDSGTILPGHGGFIDRFDAIFFSLPFVFIYLLLRAM